MIILSKVLKESNQFKILEIKVAAKRTLDNALLLIRELSQPGRKGYSLPKNKFGQYTVPQELRREKDAELPAPLS